MESFRANTVDAASAYVAISRARDGVALYTDSRARLTEALGLRDGAQVGASVALATLTAMCRQWLNPQGEPLLLSCYH